MSGDFLILFGLVSLFAAFLMKQIISTPWTCHLFFAVMFIWCRSVAGQTEQPDNYPSFALHDIKSLFESRTLYPLAAFEAGVTGKVFVEFTVTKLGEINDAKVVKGLGYGCDEEALAAVVSTSGNWNPAFQNGKPIDFKQTVAIPFHPRIDFPKMEKESEDGEDNEPEFSFVEYPPIPPEDIHSYLARKIRYPTEAINMEISGKVFVTFLITKTGAVKDVKVLKGPDINLNREAIRVVSEMPNWKPGMTGDKPVNCRMTIPVNFAMVIDKVPDVVKKDSLSAFDFQQFIDENFSEKLYPVFKSESRVNISFTWNEKKVKIENIKITNIQSKAVTQELTRIVEQLGDKLLPQPSGKDKIEVSFTVDPMQMFHCRNRFAQSKGAEFFSEPPVFLPGSFSRYVNSSMAQPFDTVGVMILSFLIDTSGLPVHPKIKHSLGPKTDLEVLRILNETKGKWTPAKLKNNNATEAVVSYALEIGNEEEAQAPGGDLASFINRNGLVPDEARKQGKEGDVGVEFGIDSAGKVYNIKIKQHSCCGWDEEALRLIRLSSGLWTPKKRNGRPISSTKSLHFHFPL